MSFARARCASLMTGGRCLVLSLALLISGALWATPDGGVAIAPVINLSVGVSAEMQAVFQELGGAFTQFGGTTVTVSAAPPAILVEKLSKGAQFDILGGGARAFPDGQIPAPCKAGGERRYARGRLAIWTRSGTPPTAAQLGDARWKKIALAEPNLEPYGRAANQALEHAGVLTDVMDRLTYRPDSAAALAFARDGRADVALVALSLVYEDKARYTIVDPELYAPIDEALMVCGKDPARVAAAKTFESFIGSPRGAQILMKHALDPQGH